MSLAAARVRHVVSVALIGVAAPGCYAQTAPQPESMTLSVQNSSEFQVNVYAAPSAPSARIRLGSVAPLSTHQLTLPQAALAAGGILRVVVDPVGSPAAWVSPTVNIGTDTRPCLRVYADSDGNLGRSTLFTHIASHGANCP